MRKVQTLCLVYQHPNILLGMKKRGFGAGRWNGFGGKVQDNESIEEAAIRETKEEAEIEVTNLEKVAIFEFSFENDPVILEGHLFKTSTFTGTPSETEEMLPQWYTTDAIPFNEMWPDDEHWFPYFLRGEKFTAKFLFGENDKILFKEITVVDSL